MHNIFIDIHNIAKLLPQRNTCLARVFWIGPDIAPNRVSYIGTIWVFFGKVTLIIPKDGPCLVVREFLEIDFQRFIAVTKNPCLRFIFNGMNLPDNSRIRSWTVWVTRAARDMINGDSGFHTPANRGKTIGVGMSP